MPKKCAGCGKKNSKTCFSCEKVGCTECIKMVCGDCGVSMCTLCKNNYHVQCGCFGTCTFCDKEVNRGDNGWPCSECKQWLCDTCRITKWNRDCEECKSNNED